MRVIQAQSAGFCYGVERAVRMAEEAAAAGGCVMLGSIIHNDSVVRRLEALGARQVQSAEEVQPGETVLIRAHGEPVETYRTLEARGARVLDATCPHVLRIHRLVERAEQEGRTPLIIGEDHHPEVIAAASRSSRSVVLGNAEELAEWLAAVPARRTERLLAVAQTTCIRSIWEKCVNFLKKECTNAEIFDTICDATQKRQSEAADIAGRVDVMVVVGDRKSANTKHLSEICSTRCARVYQIEGAEELRADFLNGCSVAGLTAGASTPAGIIKEVYATMSDEIKNVEATEESFEEMLEKSFKTLNTGEKVTGIVTAIGPTEVQVDLGCKQAGYISVDELSADPNVKPEDVVKVGDEIETYIIRVNDVEGYAMLSKKRLDAVKVWEDIEKAREEKTTLEGKVTEENKGGIVVNVKGVRVFVPASQSGLPRGAELSTMIEPDRVPAHHRGQPRPPPCGGFHQGCHLRGSSGGAGRDLEQHRGRQALHRHREVHDQLWRVRGHRRRGWYGTYLRAVLEPYQESRRGCLRGRHAGCVCYLLRSREAQDLSGREGSQHESLG